MEIYTFEQCLEAASKHGGKNHLILGNGFSVDIFPEIFNYAALADKITSESIKDLFKAMGTSDFEFVMQRLMQTARIAELYGQDDFAAQLQTDIEELKQSLVEAVSLNHPHRPGSITDIQYLSCRHFLQHFDGNKYTFNYDLLLYWVHTHFMDEPALRLDFSDGFHHVSHEDTSLHWSAGDTSPSKLQYIHGAMHIFSDGSDFEKLSYSDTGTPLSEQVRSAIAENRFPTFIAEGNSEHKLSRINHNAYLSRTMSSIHGIGGCVLIHGHSLGDSDDHVFKHILDGTQKKGKLICVSIFGDPQSEKNQAVIAKVGRWQKDFIKHTYMIYDAASAHVWDNPGVELEEPVDLASPFGAKA